MDFFWCDTGRGKEVSAGPLERSFLFLAARTCAAISSGSLEELLDLRTREAGTLGTAARDPFFGTGGVGERLLTSDDSSDGVGWAPAGLDLVCSSSAYCASEEDSSSMTLTVGASGEDSSSSFSSPAAVASLEDSSLASSSSTTSAAAEVLPLPLSVSRVDFQKESVSCREETESVS